MRLRGGGEIFDSVTPFLWWSLGEAGRAKAYRVSQVR